MRRLFSFNMVTLDGFFAGPNGDINWHNLDADFGDFAIKQLGEVDTLLFGRATYEMMAGYWPTAQAVASDPVVAGLMNNTPKLVFSRKLKQAAWSNSRLIHERVAEEIRELKQRPGKDIAIFGSAALLSSLIPLSVIDEHRLMINPVVLGQGTALFQSQERLKLRLLRTRQFGNGNVLVCYEPISS